MPDPIEKHRGQHSGQGFAGEAPGRIQPGRSNHNIRSGTPPNAKPSAACGHRVHNRQESRTAPRAANDSACPAAHNRHASPAQSTPAPPGPARPPAATAKEIWQSSVALSCSPAPGERIRAVPPRMQAGGRPPKATDLRCSRLLSGLLTPPRRPAADRAPRPTAPTLSPSIP